MRRALRSTVALAALAMLPGCVETDAVLTSTVPATLTPADAGPIAAAMADLTTRRIPASSGAISLDAPPGDTVLTPALTADLRSAGYVIADPAPHRLAYQVNSLDGDLLIRMDIDGARAARLFTHTPAGLDPAGAFTIREREASK